MDVRKLSELCKNALLNVEQVNWSKPTSKSLLVALLEKTIYSIENDGLKAKDIMFTTEELVGFVKTGNYTEQQIKKFKSDHYNETVSLLDKVNQLKKEKQAGDVYYELKISDTGEIGGAKNKKHHFLEIIETSNETNNKSRKVKCLESIVYDAVQLPKPYWFAKPFMSVELSSWRLGVFILIPIVLLLIAYLLVLQFVFSPTTETLIFIALFCMMVFLMWRSVYPFYEANVKRIAIAPQWMMKMSQVTAQFESLKLEQVRKNGRPYRKLEFVVYESVCPICGNVIGVERGIGIFRERLIGVCNESPREHLFSFDHVSKRGEKLFN